MAAFTLPPINPDKKNYPLETQADDLAQLTELRDNIDSMITHLRARILCDLGPLEGEHTTLRGRASQWDIRSLTVATVSWKKIAEQAKVAAAIIKQHTVNRQQVSFKRVPKEVTS